MIATIQISPLLSQPNKPKWDANSLTCTGVAVGVQLDVLTAYVGNIISPQAKVSYATVSYIYEDWAFTNPTDTSGYQVLTV